jgi:phage/plasmid-associated DNA primase
LLAQASQIPGVDDAAAKKRAAACAEALACGDRRNISDFLALAKVDRRILVPVTQLDSDPWLVGASNAVIELKTGTIREYSRDDYITRTLGCDVHLQATCPRWKQFMEEVFPDPDFATTSTKPLATRSRGLTVSSASSSATEQAITESLS